MSSRQDGFDDIYLGRFGGSRQFAQPSKHLWDRLDQPTVIISALVLVVSILYSLHGSYASSLEEIGFSLGQSLWDGLVRATPSRLVHAIDKRFSPQQQSSEQMIDTLYPTHEAKSAAMRRALGLNRGRDIMSSVFSVRARALSRTGIALGIKHDKERPAGLGNRNNSCFQNSVLQGLASLDKLRDYLSASLRNVDTHGRDTTNRAVTQTLRTLLSDLNDASNNGRTLWTPNKLKFMDTWTQQDAQEYYSKIIDEIDKMAAQAVGSATPPTGYRYDLEAGGKDDTVASQHSDDSGYQSLFGSSKAPDAAPFKNPLEGLLAQRVSCVQCGHSEGLSMSPSNCLTLTITPRGHHDLYERLDDYCRLESLHGVDCPKCTLLKYQRDLTTLTTKMREKGSTGKQLEVPLRRLEAVELALEEGHFDDKTIADKCKVPSSSKVTTTKTKQMVIGMPPQCLVVHINRSSFDPVTFFEVKNSAPVLFPKTLDLGPWCLGSAGGAVGGPGGNVDGEQWLENPRASMIAGGTLPSRLSGPIYELRAVVTHNGRHDYGHYICYRQSPTRRTPDTRRSRAVSGASETEKNDDGVVEDCPDGVEKSDNSTEDGSAGDASQETVWWRLSDQNVSPVDEHTIANLAPGVFMLFYECIDDSFVLQDSSETARSSTTRSSADSEHGASEQPVEPPSQKVDTTAQPSASPPAVRPESVPLPPDCEDEEVVQERETSDVGQMA
ncbi:Ubiquitin carboxyl-terminal hydrolase-like protein [Hapsidospora chrysogenum ATCC 11550]|uniref:ubiquitinyl hydrolase 1 n=1 Tax=Hapsidospora chrysogenum (strain ATCC 11550 / CBS 779.69 / DSM 880 / IAM 14645 / JCM 23072 / IMI 49137) TaxID=857340 RepID=A0A086TB87_HAPC1|nr:Ubiquitin carboxyl-terminal hydrolase-like protein [Hapsidospora chrysogenum ATCC 11550]